MPPKRASLACTATRQPADLSFAHGPDDAAFCKRVSEGLALGYALQGSPSITFNGESVIAAQAIIWLVTPG
ncbi:hypothetical protein GCM10009126_05870 [Rhodanobacter caeni]|uniref:DUF1737 domain-containing protein n=1 Tax=Rhodanobacter caeni TaxID=657654 RepID=A0ABP3DXL0_9GAMM